MRFNLTHAEMKVHSRLWLLAQNQKSRKVEHDPTLLTKGWRSGWDEIKGWPSPAFTRRLDAKLTRPDLGFCVAYEETQNCFGMEGLKKAIIHAEDSGEGIVGGWYRQEDGKLYFDSVRLCGNLGNAVKFARLNEQYGIYDLSIDLYIPINMKVSTSDAIIEAQKSRNILLR